MAGSSGKMKILLLQKILLDKTDEQHVMTASELMVELEKYGIMVSDRKTIYDDIEQLRKTGLDIVQNKGTHSGYYVGNRLFELAELKLLVDAVQVSKFITNKKSGELIKKIAAMTSIYNGKTLQREVFIHNRLKTGNETIYYNVDQIHMAISENKKINFQYSEWTAEKKMRLKKEGAVYCVSPWKLIWNDENYYLIAYDEKAECIKHYRVDKMRNLNVVEERRTGRQCFLSFNLEDFAKKTFSMYGGKDEMVSLICHNSIAGVVIDRFGKDAMLIPVDSEHFKVSVKVAVSQQFYGWVTGVGDKMVISEPKSVKEEYKKYLEQIMENY